MTPGYRDVPPRGLARLASVVATAGLATAGGLGIGFVALVFIAVVGGELDPVTWRSGVLDRMFRGTIGPVAIAIVVAIGIGLVATGAYRVLFSRQLAREAEADPARVASHQSRSVIDLIGPFGGLSAFAGYLILFGVLAIILFVATLGVTSTEEGQAYGAVLIGVALGVVASMAGLLVLVAKVWRPAWGDAVLRVRAAWSRERILAAAEHEGEARRVARVRHGLVPSSVGGAPRRLKRIARVASRVGGIAGLIGAATFFIGAYARQPGRGAPRNSYGPFGEVAIDVLMSVAVPFTVVSLAVLGLALLAEWIEDVVVQVRLARLAREGSAAPPDDVLAVALTEPWPALSAGIMLVLIGFGFGGVLVVAEIAAPGVVPLTVVPVLLALGVVGVGLMAWSTGVEAANRNRLREAWLPGEVYPPMSPRKRKRTAARENRKR